MKRILLILALLLTPIPAWAVPQVLNVAEVSESDDCDPCTMASMTISAASSGYAGTRKLFCVVVAEDATNYNISGVTINAVALSAAVQAESTTDNNIAEIWFLDDASLPAAGDYTVSVDFTEAVSDFGVVCWVMEGVAQGAASDTDVAESDSLATATLALTVNPTDLVVTVATHNALVGTTWTHGANQNEVADFVFATDNTGAMSATWGIGISAPASTSNSSANRFAMAAASWEAAVISATRRRAAPRVMQ